MKKENTKGSQKFEGDPYLKINNELLGAIILSKGLLTNIGKVFMLILFKTVGFKKKDDWLTWRQISKFTQIKEHSRIFEAIKKTWKKVRIFLGLQQLI